MHSVAVVLIVMMLVEVIMDIAVKGIENNNEV
jgi:hypothetical protein